MWLSAPLKAARALAQALAVIRRRRPALVVGLGGFVAGPGGLAAWLLRRPLLIHEQNAIAGFTNRCLAHLARRVLDGLSRQLWRWRAGRSVIGNPVRREITLLPAPPSASPRAADRFALLIVGGSQGAARLNAIVPFALARAEHVDLARRAASVRRALDRVRAAQLRTGRHDGARLQPFIDDMAEAYGWADLVICRAGALTVSELAAAGVAAILVPFPAATDDHQTRNAAFLVE